jgi:hypothetical protein
MKQGQDVLDNPPRKLQTRFELAAARIADAWLDSRHISTTAADYRMAREFLEEFGWVVEPRPGLTVRILREHTFSEEIPREEMVAIALRLVLRQVAQQLRATPRPGERAPAAA